MPRRIRAPRSAVADPNVDDLIGELSPSLRPIAVRLRELVRRSAPGLRETVKWGAPVWVGRTNVLCLMIYPDHLNLGFFQGALLSQKHPEIVGTGKALRHVKILTVADSRRPVLARLIREAVRLDARE
jgi:hypothetical protein